MTFLSRLAVTGLACAALGAAAAAQPANNNLAPGIGAGKVLRAQLAIKGPTTTQCPNQATLTAWVFTNYPGNVTIMIARQGQGVGAPKTITAVPAANGQYMATYSQTVPILTPIDALYRVLVGGGDGVTSNWAPLKASCAMAPGPNNVEGG